MTPVPARATEAKSVDVPSAAGGVRAWLAAGLPRLPGGPSDAGAALRRSDLLADGAAQLRAAHARLIAEGVTPQAAGTHLLAWFAGDGAGAAVGVTLARAGAGLVLDPATVRWHIGEDGRPRALDIGRSAVLVPSGHAWACRPGASVVADDAAVRRAAVRGLVEFVGPLLDACQPLARVGAGTLWAQIADGLGCVFAGRTDVGQQELDVLASALATPGVPWRRAPVLGWAPSERLGRVHIARRSGCCLYFTCPQPGPGTHDDNDDNDDSPEVQAFRARFPDCPDQRTYCSSCRFRELTDVAARQVYWRELGAQG